MNRASFLLPLLLALAGFQGAAQAQDAAAGQKLIASCIGCHGIPGYQASFPEVHRVPMIAGQNARYIVAALAAYKKGDRKHPTMRGAAGSMSDKDMADVAAFYEQQGRGGIKPVAERAAPPASPAVAALLAKGACASCHGADFNKPIDGAYPKLAGQHADYLYVALKSYQIQGKEQVGRNNAVMVGIAKPYTLAELRVIAQYLGSLPGELRTVPEPKFR